MNPADSTLAYHYRSFEVRSSPLKRVTWEGKTPKSDEDKRDIFTRNAAERS